MELKPEGYYEIAEFLIAKVKADWKRLVDASMNIVTAFRICIIGDIAIRI